ncbi:MAG TPA: phosphoribosyltransferase family protein [Flavitalea sp.]|nr:phosphoribosyltransferase family protein [Flavitalea sp.]
MTRNYILNEETAHRKLTRLAYEVLEYNSDISELIIAGIEQNGVVVARNIERILKEISNLKVTFITVSLDKKQPGEVKINPVTDWNGTSILLIDDVSNSGKTMLYALKPFLTAQPRSIQTLTLVERTHTAFPVRPDYVGLSVATTLQEHIFVEVDGNNVKGAWLE